MNEKEAQRSRDALDDFIDWFKHAPTNNVMEGLTLYRELRGRSPIVAVDKGSDMGDAMAMTFLAGGRTETPERMFLRDVEDELAKARAKFPYSGGANTALAEEVGELAKALLDETPQRIYREAVQVATMAARIALEGDPLLDQYRTIRQGVGASPARGLRP